MIELSESMIYEFEEFRLDAKSRRLFRRAGGELVPLTPKAVELLLFLIRNAGRILSKEELLDTVWENSFVEEANLSQTIFVLRKTLGETTKKPRFILTAPNRGYQFIAPVKEIKADDEMPEVGFFSKNISFKIQNPEFKVKHPNPKSKIQNPKSLWFAVSLVVLIGFGIYWFYPAAKPATVSEIRTIAVLPFEDLSAGQTEKYLGVSLADALANKFGGLKQITVRPTRTVLKYAESREEVSKIGRELQVDAVLDGRIQRVGEQIRVSVQLIRTADNTTLWTENFDDQFTNFFAVQDSISQKVVGSLALRIDEKEREKFNRRGTENAAAYQEYLLGRFFWNKRSADDLNHAIEHFNRAVQIDPNFAESYAGLAETYAIYPFYAVDEDKDALPKAREAANRALAIDGELAEAYTALAYVQSQYDFDWKSAEKSYLRAIELNPNLATTRQWYGEFLAFQNRTDEGLVQMLKAVELDPTSLSANNAPALAYNASQQFEKALETTEKVLQMDANFLIAQHYRARALFFLGRREEAFEIYRKVIAVSNGSAYFKADLGCLYGIAGQKAEARKILAELVETAKSKPVSPYYFAIIYIGLNERARAFEFLRKAVAEHDNNVIVLKVGANFDSVRNDPEFIEILRSANFQL
ncbi:MAG TPA: winged helix-turn-helix domain-containing protein [Pyrinomonadaceae bacterium]|nr:winged helix-turn-helix domain-containing protein [Pyrinomonadaceae bacterium]